MHIADAYPAELWELDEVLRWAGHNPKNAAIASTVKLLFERPWVRQTPKNHLVLFLGTRKFDNGTRQLLIDSPTVEAVRRDLLQTPPAPSPSRRIVTPPAAVLEPSPRPVSTSYLNLVRLELGRPRLRNTLLYLRRSTPKRIKLANKRRELLQSAADALAPSNAVRVAGIPQVFLALCVGVHEIHGRRKKKRVLEVGWAKWVGGEAMTKIEVKHCIVKENQAWRNGKFVPNRIEEFIFGKSLTVSFEEARQLLIHDLSPTPPAHLTIIGNTIRYPISVLELDFHLSAFQTTNDDVGVLFRAARRDQAVQSTLTDMLEFYGIPFIKERIHNAGNDAKYILELFRVMTTVETSK